MKKFSFNLQGILDYWLRLEQQEKTELSRLYSEQRKLSAKLHKVRQSIQKSQVELQQKKEVPAPEIHLYGNYLQNAKLMLNSLTKEEQQLGERLAKQLEVLRAATKKRKTLERLRSRRQQLYSRELNRKEQQEIDELYLLGQRNT